MTSYGQSVTPKFFADQSAKQFTKSQFMCYLHKALLTVGMIPIRPFFPLTTGDIGVITEYPVPGDRNDTIWFYDFPTTETFMIKGLTYRPCLMITALVNIDNNSDNGTSGSDFNVILCRRRADRLLLSDIDNFPRWIIDSSQQGAGNYNGSRVGLGQEGATFRFWPWRPSTGPVGGSFPANYVTLLGVQNFQIVLTKAGLLFQIGTGITKTDNNNLLNCLICFAGERVPGQARIPMDDPNLNLINPTLMFAFNTTGSGNWYSQAGCTLTNLSMTGKRFVSNILGMQSDFDSTLHPVLSQCFNLENIQYPLFPLCGSDTKDSPRLVSGVGSSILQRMVYVSWSDWVTSGVFYGPKDPSIRQEPVPTWADVWTAEGFRYGDQTAPMGDYTDPTSGLLWHLFLAPAIPQMCAVNIQGVTRYNIFNLPSITYTPYHFDFTSAGFSSTFPLSSTVEHADGHWTWSSGDVVTTTNWQSTSYEFTFTIPVGAVDVKTSFVLNYSFYNYTDSAGQPEGYNLLYAEYSVDGGSTWIAANSSPMLNPNDANYNVLVAVSAPIPIPQTPSNGTIRIRFTTSATFNFAGNWFAAISDIVLTKQVSA